MKQPIRGKKGKPTAKKVKGSSKSRPSVKVKGSKAHQQKYGTSKLERDFARDFLDRNGIVYIYQYEAKDIKRFFDFAVTSYGDVEYITETKDGIRSVSQEGQYFPVSFMIEIDGGYYHSDPRVVDTENLNPMQKHNRFVDRIKDQWCGMHCIPILRIWEYDIRNNPRLVLEELGKYIDLGMKKKRIDENRKKPH